LIKNKSSVIFKTCIEKALTLTLLMTWLFANDPYGAIATNNFTITANFLYRCAHFHSKTPNRNVPL